MFECCDYPVQLCQFPTELLIYIFKFLSAKNLIACRQVCRRWKKVVDSICSDNDLWEKHCENDFKTLYRDAMKKSNFGSLWFELYRSLSLWGRLSDATETRDEFCHSFKREDTIENVSILKNCIVAVHKNNYVVFHDILTLEPTERPPICGVFAKFGEYDDVILLLGGYLHLRVIKQWKIQDTNENVGNKIRGEKELVFRNTRTFWVFDNNLYFVNFESEIFHCNLDKELAVVKLPRPENDNVLTMSFFNGSLHALTAERNVYKFQDDKFVLLFNLKSKKSNIFDCLWHYEFLSSLDWIIFNIWLTSLRIPIPESPLGYISTIKVYGDVIFIGCKNGIMLIYYKPYTDGHLDLINHDPVKQYRFAEREDIPVLSLHPILSIDVLEIMGGHKILVGMPKKIIVLTIMHTFEIVKSKAVVPYVPAGSVVLKA